MAYYTLFSIHLLAASPYRSVGCLLYELVALQHAFEGESLMGVMYKIVEGTLPDWPSGYSMDLKAVFIRFVAIRHYFW